MNTPRHLGEPPPKGEGAETAGGGTSERNGAVHHPHKGVATLLVMSRAVMEGVFLKKRKNETIPLINHRVVLQD